jgi:hypothetical protein
MACKGCLHPTPQLLVSFHETQAMLDFPYKVRKILRIILQIGVVNVDRQYGRVCPVGRKIFI